MPSLLSCSGLDVVFLDTMTKNIICMLVYLYFACIFMVICFFSFSAGSSAGGSTSVPPTHKLSPHCSSAPWTKILHKSVGCLL